MLTPPPYLPPSPGVYKFFDKRWTVLYIGKAKHIAKRVQQYFTPGSLWKQEMVAEATRIEWIETTTERDALLLEDTLIKEYLPEYNKLLRSNSGYVFLKIPKWPFPLLSIVKKRSNDGSTYIGPRYGSKQLRMLLRHLRQIYQFHQMKPIEFKKGTLSTDYFFGLDKGRSVIALMKDLPSVGENPPKRERGHKQQLLEQAVRQWFHPEKSYEAYVQDYKQIVHAVSACFEGKTKTLLTHIKKQIEQHSQHNHFERCAKLRDVYQFIETLERSYPQIILKKPVSWYLGKLSETTHYRVIVLLHIVEGKVVDIIREKKHKDDLAADQLVLQVETEFSAHYDPETTLFTTPSLRTLSPTEQTHLEDLLQSSFHSYLHATAMDNEDNLMIDLLKQLQATYGLTRIPLRMECIDISHLSGSSLSGWLSCFIHGTPAKTQYRHYKIRSVKEWTSDDYQSLREVLTRRFHLTKQGYQQAGLPDLMIIDGGKGQLGILRDLTTDYPILTDLLQHVDVIALGKGEARQRSKKLAWAPEVIYKVDPDGSIREYALSYDHADQIIVKLRDEAHRFANRYRKKQQKMYWTNQTNQ